MLEQIPAQLVLKDTISMMGSGQFGRATFVVPETLNLDGPYLNFSAQNPDGLRVKVDDLWNVGLGKTGLPPQLWPYVAADRVYAEAAPTVGTWRAGQVVWRELGAGNGGRLGWKCTEGGTPGTWVEMDGAEPTEGGGSQGAAGVDVSAWGEMAAEARLHPQRPAGRWDAQTGRP